MSCYGKTNQGMLRDNNEDYFFFSDRSIGSLPNLYVVADGMGGHNAGEIASYTAVNEFISFIESYNGDGCDSDILDILTEAIQYANKKTYELSLEKTEYVDMGTTLVACVISGNKIYIVNVGDSRLYRFRDGVLSQLTNDHTYVAMLVKRGEITEEEALIHPQRNIITRAVGTDCSVRCDGSFFDVCSRDLYILCSDGLTAMVSEDEVSEVLADNSAVEEKVNRLIDLANEKGGRDNITIIITDARAEV